MPFSDFFKSSAKKKAEKMQSGTSLLRMLMKNYKDNPSMPSEEKRDVLDRMRKTINDIEPILEENFNILAGHDKFNNDQVNAIAREAEKKFSLLHKETCNLIITAKRYIELQLQMLKLKEEETALNQKNLQVMPKRILDAVEYLQIPTIMQFKNKDKQQPESTRKIRFRGPTLEEEAEKEEAEQRSTKSPRPGPGSS